MKNHYFEILLNLAKKAAKHNEVPVSALIVYKNKIIAKSYNKRHKSKYIANHCEMLVIKKASRKLKSWHLQECELYVTLKPCNMCEAAIKQSQIKNVYYLLNKDNSKKEYYNTKISKANISALEKEYAKCLSDFFLNLRDKKKHI